MRDKVLGFGWPFRPIWSSNSRRRPVLFDWTDDPGQATVDTVVYISTAIPDGINEPGRKIAWLLESPAICRWQRTMPWIESNFEAVIDAYEVILSCDRTFCARHPKIQYHPAGSNLPWIPESRYAIYKKDRLCSMFASNKNMVWEHRYRKQAAEQLADRLDLFGGAADSRRIGSGKRHPDKSDGLFRYHFQVVMENSRVDLYYTEKITDCFATGTIPIYWGAETVGEICDTNGILIFDESFDPNDLSEDLYFEMLPAVRTNLELVKQLESSDDLLYRSWIAESRAVAVAGISGSPRPWGQVTAAEPTEALPPWDPAPILASRITCSSDSAALIERVRTSTRSVIEHGHQVAPDRCSTARIATRMARPRSLRSPNIEWYPQLETACLLHLPDGFIGDGVLFDDQHMYSLDRWWWASGRGQGYARLVERVEHESAAISIAAWGGEAFQHFILDAVPQLGAVIDLLETPEMADVKIVSHCGDQARFATWFWQRLGMLDRVVLKPRNVNAGFVVHADLAMAVVFEPSLDRLGLYPRHVLRPIQQRLGVLEPSERDLVLYLRRGGVRNVADEDTLLERLRREIAGSGLELVIRQGGRSWDDELELFRRARVIVGPHGGAFGNLLFAQPGSHVIEFVPQAAQLAPHSNNLAMYWGLAQAAGLHYWQLEPLSFDFDGPDLEVDVDEVAATLRQILSA